MLTVGVPVKAEARVLLAAIQSDESSGRPPSLPTDGMVALQDLQTAPTARHTLSVPMPASTVINPPSPAVAGWMFERVYGVIE